MTTKILKREDPMGVAGVVLMKTWNLFWSPEGRKIATVRAMDAHAAIAKTPKPWAKYKGEVYAKEK